MNQSALIFWQLFKRDMYVARKQVKKLFVNCCILYPCWYIFTYAYLQAHIFFNSATTNTSLLATSILIGSALLIMLIISYNLIIPLIFDIEEDKFINYQITLLNPQLVLLERIVFSSLLTFVLICPFYPVGKLILQGYFQTQDCSWVQVFVMLLLSSVVVSAYHHFIICSLKSSRLIARVWSRCTDPLLVLGGYWIPWHIVNKFSPTLSYITFANPFMYITEGLRQSFLHQPHFFPFVACVAMLVGYACLFTAGSFYYFKKRMDHI